MNIADLLKTGSIAISQATDSRRPFNIVLLYDHETSALHSRRLIDPLLLKCLPELDIHRDEWSFLEVAHPQLRAETVELARECDLFVLAALVGASLNAPVISWMNLWLASRADKDAALVCLIGSTDGNVSDGALHQQLQSLAQQHGLAFFASGFAVRETDNFLCHCATDEPALSERHPRLYFPRPERWGINE